MNNKRTNKKSYKSIIGILLNTIIMISLVMPVMGSTRSQERVLALNQFLPVIQRTVASWPMVGANPQRTSWTSEQVSGNLHVEWYRPIEAYIPQNAQVIATEGKLFISTAKGLYVLNAIDGEIVWRYDTELPLGNSPTVYGGIVYVGGYDHKLHALDAFTGAHLWEFAGAQAGFDTNPLVIEGKVILGNRDGSMYAIGAHNTPQQGQLVWKYNTGGPIHLSAAYKAGIIYFASDDNYAYALRASTGELVWKSQKLPGDGYHSYWPVIFKDKVIFSAAKGYRGSLSPGSNSMAIAEKQGIFPENQEGLLLGPEVPEQSWANGYPIIDANRLTEYFEDNPDMDQYKHKPWRRTAIVLNMVDGSEFTFDSDGDNYPEYIPLGWWGTNSGNRYPALVGMDNLLYSSNIYNCCSNWKGMVMGWNIETPSLLSVKGGFGALAEPQAISAGGNLIYRNLCCDRMGDYFDIRAGGVRRGTLWSYNLTELAPGYDEMWTILPGWPRLFGYYRGKLNTINSAYHNHGDQNPIIPYNGKLYVHRSNAIIAFGSGQSLGKLPLLEINPVEGIPAAVDQQALETKLSDEILKILDAGHLRPGYYNSGGQFSLYQELADYFDNPGDTLLTLARAYPYLSSTLQERTRTYLKEEFLAYFDPVMYVTVGWSEGAAREAMPLPAEVQADLVNYPPRLRADPGFSWEYPQQNFYAMWRYATIFPEDAVRIYELAKGKLQVPIPTRASAEYLREEPYQHNAYIGGYLGFLKLQEFAGMDDVDQSLRQQVTDELNRLLELKVSIFSKDSYWGPEDFRYKKLLDIARNFIFLTPELGDYMNQNMLPKIQEAINEYEYIAPYWFVPKYEAVIGEGVMSNLYNYYALFQAKAYILNEPAVELVKYLDAPSFERGDLFYIQNLIAVIEAYPYQGQGSTTPDNEGNCDG